MIPWHISSKSFLHLDFDRFGHVLLNTVSTELHWFQNWNLVKRLSRNHWLRRSTLLMKVEAGNCSPRMCVYCLSNCHDRSFFLLHWGHILCYQKLFLSLCFYMYTVYRLYSMYSIYMLYKHILVYWSDYSLDSSCTSHSQFGWLSQED